MPVINFPTSVPSNTHGDHIRFCSRIQMTLAVHVISLSRRGSSMYELLTEKRYSAFGDSWESAEQVTFKRL